MKQKVSVPFMLLGILFGACLVAVSLLETKVIQVFDITATTGLLVFLIFYVINDCIAEVWGFRRTYLVIWSGFAMNFFVVMLELIAIALPAAPLWEGVPHSNLVLGMAPRIVAASSLAFPVGSFLNVYVTNRIKVASSGRHFPACVIRLTVAGEIADSPIFFPVVFGGIVAWQELLVIMCTQIALKSLYRMLILPVAIRVMNAIKRIDGNDVCDEGASCKVWKISEA